jgi:hypothetical protein
MRPKNRFFKYTMCCTKALWCLERSGARLRAETDPIRLRDSRNQHESAMQERTHKNGDAKSHADDFKRDSGAHLP